MSARSRLVLVGLVLLSLWLAAHVSGLTGRVTAEGLRRAIAGAGPLGVLGFVAVFALGELCGVPGLVFVAAAVLSYGHQGGALVAYLGALASITVAFVVVRGIGGRALTAMPAPWLQRGLARLDRHPYRTVILLRAVLFIFPPLNYALALSGLSFRDYFLASAIGLVGPVIVTSLLIEQLAAWLGLAMVAA